MTYVWTGFSDWFVRSQASTVEGRSVLLPVAYGVEAADSIITLCRLLPVDRGLITTQAVRSMVFFFVKHALFLVQLNGYRLPPRCTMGLVPCSGFCAVHDKQVLATCPSLPASFPSQCSFPRLHRAMDEMRNMLFSCGCLPSVAALGCGSTSDAEQMEREQRLVLGDMASRCRSLLEMLWRFGALALMAGGSLGVALIHPKPPALPGEVVEQIIRRQLDNHRCILEGNLAGHTGSSSLSVGTIATAQSNMLLSTLKHVLMDLATFLQVAMESGFDAAIVPSLVCGTTSTEMLRIHQTENIATLGSHTAMLHLFRAVLQTREQGVLFQARKKVPCRRRAGGTTDWNEPIHHYDHVGLRVSGAPVHVDVPHAGYSGGYCILCHCQ